MNDGGDSTVRTHEEYVEVIGGTLVALPGGSHAAGTPVLVGAEPCIVGRSPHCHLSIADSYLSNSHCSFMATPEGVCVTDLGSLNGTWINGVRLKSGSSVFVPGSARVRAGQTWLELRVAGHERVPISGAMACGPLVGRSAAMRELYARIERVAPTPLNVLITGETGTGKELVARAIHEASGRRGKLVVIDCGTIPASLAESKLFGHEKGAFTGADTRRRSPFHEAGGGTIFIDELGELPGELQPKLLRAIEAREIQAVGSSRYEKIDVRIVAATRRDLHAEMNADRFRNDLYFRFAQRVMAVPPLRKHAEDIPALVSHFLLADFEDPGALSRIDALEMDRLKRHDWPGNVRELRNVLLAAHVESDGGPIQFGEILSPGRGGSNLADRVSAAQSFVVQKDALLGDFVRAYFTKLHGEARGNISEMERRSGLSRGQIRTHLRRLGLHEK